MNIKNVVAISGYFNPLHVGHLDYLREASKLGSRLIVIVNNDKQVKLKGSVPFMNEGDRIRIVSSLKWVDEVILAVDKDGSVCETLKRLRIKPDIFCNGGDRKRGNTPEEKLCKELGIETVYGVGGEKVQSSSDLIKNLKIRR